MSPVCGIKKICLMYIYISSSKGTFCCTGGVGGEGALFSLTSLSFLT